MAPTGSLANRDTAGGWRAVARSWDAGSGVCEHSSRVHTWTIDSRTAASSDLSTSRKPAHYACLSSGSYLIDCTPERSTRAQQPAATCPPLRAGCRPAGCWGRCGRGQTPRWSLHDWKRKAAVGGWLGDVGPCTDVLGEMERRTAQTRSAGHSVVPVCRQQAPRGMLTTKSIETAGTDWAKWLLTCRQQVPVVLLLEEGAQLLAAPLHGHTTRLNVLRQAWITVREKKGTGGRFPKWVCSRPGSVSLARHNLGVGLHLVHNCTNPRAPKPATG